MLLVHMPIAGDSSALPSAAWSCFLSFARQFFDSVFQGSLCQRGSP